MRSFNKFLKEGEPEKNGKKVSVGKSTVKINPNSEELKEKIDVGADASATIRDFVHSKSKTFTGDSKKQRIKRALGAYYGAQTEGVVNERADTWHPDPEQDRKLGGPGANQRAREDRAAASQPKADPKKLRPGESYMQYAKRQQRSESAVPGQPAERLGAVTAIPSDEREAAKQRTLAKAAALRKKREEQKEEFEINEAEGSYGQTPKATAAYGALANRRRNTPASEYPKRGAKKVAVQSAERHMSRSENPDAGNRGKQSTKPHWTSGSRKGMTPKDRNWRRGADEYGHSGYDGEGGGGSLPKGKKLTRQRKTGVSEATRYEKETGKDYKTGKEVTKGGTLGGSDTNSAVMRHMHKRMGAGRMGSNGPIQPRGQKKVPGKKPPSAGEYGSGVKSPAQKLAAKRATIQKGKDNMSSRFD
jgi:hypothetical protein